MVWLERLVKLLRIANVGYPFMVEMSGFLAFDGLFFSQYIYLSLKSTAVKAFHMRILSYIFALS